MAAMAAVAICGYGNTDPETVRRAVTEKRKNKTLLLTLSYRGRPTGKIPGEP